MTKKRWAEKHKYLIEDLRTIVLMIIWVIIAPVVNTFGRLFRKEQR